MKYFAIAILSLLLVGCTAPQDRTVLVESLKKRTVLILVNATCTEPDGSTIPKEWIGAGVLFEKDGKTKIMTAAHVLTSENKNDKISTIQFWKYKDPTRFSAAIERISSNQDACDCAILTPNLSMALPQELKIGATPRAGEELHTVGHALGFTGQWAYSYGRVSEPWRIDFDSYWVIEASMPVCMGHSGGGAFDNKGNFLGIVRSVRGPYTFIVPAGLISSWISSDPVKVAPVKDN